MFLQSHVRKLSYEFRVDPLLHPFGRHFLKPPIHAIACSVRSIVQYWIAWRYQKRLYLILHTKQALNALLFAFLRWMLRTHVPFWLVHYSLKFIFWSDQEVGQLSNVIKLFIVKCSWTRNHEFRFPKSIKGDINCEISWC